MISKDSLILTQDQDNYPKIKTFFCYAHLSGNLASNPLNFLVCTFNFGYRGFTTFFGTYLEPA